MTHNTFLNNSYKNFIEQYVFMAKAMPSATIEDVKEADSAVVFGTKICVDSCDIADILKNSKAKIVYMHPIEEHLLDDNIAQFVKYEPSSEHAIAALLAFNLCDRQKLSEKQKSYLELLDDGFLSGEASFDETEQEHLVNLLNNLSKKVLIVGADLYMHPNANLIAKLLGMIAKSTNIKILMLPIEQIDINLENNFIEEYEEIESIDEMNGSLVYFCSHTKDIITGSKSFATAAKVVDGKTYNAYINNETYKVVFQLDSKMKGTIATMMPKSPGYRFMPVVMREE
ncbi:MAG: hypothetical protein RL154_1370 [Pseudomonadota bacterium]|jgi:hypothetical protein